MLEIFSSIYKKHFYADGQTKRALLSQNQTWNTLENVLKNKISWISFMKTTITIIPCSMVIIKCLCGENQTNRHHPVVSLIIYFWWKLNWIEKYFSTDMSTYPATYISASNKQNLLQILWHTYDEDVFFSFLKLW